MQSPGELIRDARRRRGLSPEEVFRVARVRPGLLENIEEDVLTALPEDPYARGLYATLARTVGADADRVLAAYDELRSVRDVVVREPVVRAEPEAPSGSRPMGYAIGGVAVLLVIALVWIGGARKGHDGNADDRHAGRERTRDTREVQAASSRTGEGSVAAKTIDPGMPDAVPLFATPLDTTPGEIAAGTAGTSPVSTGAASTGATTSDSPFTGEDTVPPPPTEAVRIQRVRAPREGDAASIAPGATVQPLDSDLPGLPGVTSPDAELVLQANASRDTWIRVAIDGTRTRSGILPAGESRSWRARNELRVDTGAIEDVTFQLNDRPVDVGEPRTGVGHLLMSWAPAMTDTAGPDSGGAATPDP